MSPKLYPADERKTNHIRRIESHDISFARAFPSFQGSASDLGVNTLSTIEQIVVELLSRSKTPVAIEASLEAATRVWSGRKYDKSKPTIRQLQRLLHYIKQPPTKNPGTPVIVPPSPNTRGDLPQDVGESQSEDSDETSDPPSPAVGSNSHIPQTRRAAACGSPSRRRRSIRLAEHSPANRPAGFLESCKGRERERASDSGEATRKSHASDTDAGTDADQELSIEVGRGLPVSALEQHMRGDDLDSVSMGDSIAPSRLGSTSRENESLPDDDLVVDFPSPLTTSSTPHRTLSQGSATAIPPPRSSPSDNRRIVLSSNMAGSDGDSLRSSSASRISRFPGPSSSKSLRRQVLKDIKIASENYTRAQARFTKAEGLVQSLMTSYRIEQRECALHEARIPTPDSDRGLEAFNPLHKSTTTRNNNSAPLKIELDYDEIRQQCSADKDWIQVERANHESFLQKLEKVMDSRVKKKTILKYARETKRLLHGMKQNIETFSAAEESLHRYSQARIMECEDDSEEDEEEEVLVEEQGITAATRMKWRTVAR